MRLLEPPGVLGIVAEERWMVLLLLGRCTAGEPPWWGEDNAVGVVGVVVVAGARLPDPAGVRGGEREMEASTASPPREPLLIVVSCVRVRPG
jgi:hypothetical protein